MKGVQDFCCKPEKGQTFVLADASSSFPSGGNDNRVVAGLSRGLQKIGELRQATGRYIPQ